MSTQPTYLGYGSDKLSLFVPEHTVHLGVTDPKPTITVEIFRKRLKTFLKKEQLDLSRPIIVVADKTRLCGYPEYLPVLINELCRQGMDPSTVQFLIAYGTHPNQTREECLTAYGEMYDTHPFLHHNSSDQDCFRELGTTRRGTPVRLRKDLLDASAVITIGAVSHHYFAGYGGGRKLVFPGCGEKEAIYKNHSLFLDKDGGLLAPGCQPGNLEENPLAEDLFEIEEYLPAQLSIHGLLDSRGKVCDLLVGRGRELFDAACKRQGESCEISSEQFDVVVASCGGFPKDINFIQAHKAVHNSAMFVKDGGTLLVYCECRDDVGSVTFLPWFEKDSFEEAFTLLSQSYEGNGGTALSMMTKCKRITIGLVTSLDESITTTIGASLWHHSDVSDFLAKLPQEKSIACIGNASLLVKKQ